MDNYLKRKRSPSLPARSSTGQHETNNPSPSKKPPIPLQPNGLANPSRTIFDPWNSVSIGHQRAENHLSGSTSWRDSRNHKLRQQYRSGLGGGERLYDTVGAGSKDFGKDGRKVNGRWHKSASGRRTDGQLSIVESLGKTEGRRDTPIDQESVEETASPAEDFREDTPGPPDEDEAPEEKPKKQIFRNLCFHINGSTAPLISDHKLKYLLAEHGGAMSIALGRRTVTHVIVGTTQREGGAGGGLAGGKIQKEIARVGGKGVKFVSAQWVVESIKAGKRLSEAQFANTRLVAPSGQRSVLGMFKSEKPEQQTAESKEKG